VILAAAASSFTFAAGSSRPSASRTRRNASALLDRAGPGIDLDVVIFHALKDALVAQIDLVATNALLAGAATVTNSGSLAITTTSGLGGMAKDVVLANAKLTDTAGVRLQPTHLFATSDVIDAVIGYADGQGGNLFPPTWADGAMPVSYAGDCVLRMWKEESSRSDVRLMQCCTRDEGARPVVGWPFAVALQGEAANHREVRW
jgi:hypothetical protein